jgi:phenylacetate-CoA ligase
MNSNTAKFLFFFPVRLLRSEPILRALAFVKDCESLDQRALIRRQFDLVTQQVDLAFEKIPYFRSHWAPYFKIKATISGWEEFAMLPVLEKIDIQSHQKQFLCAELTKIDHRGTSGSTGTPLRFVKDRQATAFMDAVMYHAYSWYGINIGDRQARFWGLPQDDLNRNLAYLKDFLMNRKRLSAFQLSPAAFETFAAQIKRWRPHYFYGYPSLVIEFARFVDEYNVKLAAVDLKAIICTGEQLETSQKEYLRQVFKCPVVNEYGSTEVGVIGFECPAGSLHEMSSNIYFEVLKDGIPVVDEEGTVVVTELHALTSPFIRYKIGDRGVRCSAPCPCGLPYPVIKVLSGRIDDYILTPDGRKVYDAILAYTLKKGVKKFKAIQREVRSLEIMIVADDELDDEMISQYTAKLKLGISSDMDFIFKKVAAIPQEKSGKLRYFQSEIH